MKQGVVRYIGLSEMSAETVRRANAVHPIVDMQIEYSVVTRGIGRLHCRHYGRWASE